MSLTLAWGLGESVVLETVILPCHSLGADCCAGRGH